MSNIDFTQTVTAQAKSSAALASAQAGALRRLIADLSDFAEQLTGPVPDAEKLSWRDKEAEARAYLAGTETAFDSQMLQIEAAATGEKLPDLAAAIVAATDSYRQAAAAISGIRRKYRDQISVAGSLADLPAPGAWQAELAALTV